MTEIQDLVKKYNQVLKNTVEYREKWSDSLRKYIMEELEKLLEQADLDASVKLRDKVSNLEAIELTLGRSESGLSHRVNKEIERALIKYNGALIYQQLFNGKVMVLIHYPYIENYLNPRPPRTLAIYKADEFRDELFTEHFKEFLRDITAWEDFEQDEPHKQIGFKLNFDQEEEGQENV